MKRLCLALILVSLPLSAQPRETPPFALPAGVTVERDLVYARYGSRELKLDLYRPATGAGPFPGIVFIHGGGWRNGNRNAFRRQAAYLATKGFVGACIEYRLSGEAIFPAAVYDSKAAVRWMRANAAKYKINPNEIGAAGGSAGGHLAAMLGTSAGVRKLEGDGGNAGVSSRVEAVVAFNGVFDFVSLGQKPTPDAREPMRLFLGGTYDQVPQVYAAASPVTYISKRSAPFLLLHGDADATVPYQQSVEMQKKLQVDGVRAELYTASGAKHGFFNGPPFYQPALERMEQFFESVLLRK